MLTHMTLCGVKVASSPGHSHIFKENGRTLKTQEWPGDKANVKVEYACLYITVPEEVTTYTTLIADVHDESSDFELPDTVVA